MPEFDKQLESRIHDLKLQGLIDKKSLLPPKEINMDAGDHVTLNLKDTDDYFNGKIGIYIKTLTPKEIKELIQEGRWDDLCGPIVIDVVSMKEIYFNNHSSIPEKEKKWLFMKKEEIILRKKGTKAGPLSIEELIPLELNQMATPPYINIGYLPSRKDRRCWILDCKEDEHDGIWFNVWGSGTRIPVCKNHFDKHGKLTLCDGISIDLKKKNE